MLRQAFLTALCALFFAAPAYADDLQSAFHLPQRDALTAAIARYVPSWLPVSADALLHPKASVSQTAFASHFSLPLWQFARRDAQLGLTIGKSQRERERHDQLPLIYSLYVQSSF
ncbi:MAG TPA: hypothetical protein V6D47_20640 [Oscillatoriaceae cyanobacterium]